MSDSVRPQRWQPTRLPHPWDSPGKNTGVSCHCLLQWMKVKSESEVAQWCPTLSDPMDCSLPGSSVHGIFQATVLEWIAVQETWVQCLSQEDPWEEKMATHSSTVAWKIPWTEEPDGLQSVGSQRDRKSTRLNSSHTDSSRMPSSA